MNEVEIEKHFRRTLIESGFHVWPKVEGNSTPDVLFEGANHSFAFELKKKGNVSISTRKQRSLITKLRSYKKQDSFIIKMIDVQEVLCLIGKKISTNMLLSLQDMTNGK